jgi:predicted GNAT family acetyltransferase
MPDVQHEPAQNRFAATVEGGTAELEYQRADDVLIFVHTFVPEAARGEDVGAALVEAALDHVRENDLRLVAQCPFVKHYVEEHPEAQALVAR